MNEADIKQILDKQHEFFAAGLTLNVDYRLAALERLRDSIKTHEKDIEKALIADMGKSAYEGYICETGLALSKLRYICRHLKSWAGEKRVHTSLVNFPSESKTVQEPYGTVLIMAPWNYPILLSLEPLIGAVAAGNTAIVKPSQYAPESMKILKTVVEEAFDPSYAAVICGGRAENGILLEQKFDYIFFTGSVAVGKLVMEKAAKHLTPVTLELGGKSPVIVDKSADIKLAAKRVAFGKIVNCGQTCIAPDYVLVEESVKDEFIKRYARAVKRMLGAKPLKNKNYGRIINKKHYDRLCGLMQSENIVLGGERDDEKLRIAPTVIDGVDANAPIMNQEIFGPILPVMTFKDIGEAKQFVVSRQKPLACYVFTNDKAVEKLFTQTVSFGGGCINDTINHIVSDSYGFGGVGESGMGSYHGKKSFDTFSHEKSILKKSQHIDIPLRYHPYRKIYEPIVRLLLR